MILNHYNIWLVASVSFFYRCLKLGKYWDRGFFVAGSPYAHYSEGKWINAVDRNFSGTRKFVVGPYKAKYGLGTYGVDPSTKTAWAVVNYSADFAVANDIDPVPRHRK